MPPFQAVGVAVDKAEKHKEKYARDKQCPEKPECTGKKLIVASANIDDRKIAAGTYQAADLSEVLLDSSEEQTGILFVTGTGTGILVR